MQISALPQYKSRQNNGTSFKATRLFPVNLCEKATKKIIPAFFTEIKKTEDLPEIETITRRWHRLDIEAYAKRFFDSFRERHPSAFKNNFFAIEIDSAEKPFTERVTTLIKTYMNCGYRELGILQTDPELYKGFGAGEVAMYSIVKTAGDASQIFLTSTNHGFYRKIGFRELPIEALEKMERYFFLPRAEFGSFTKRVAQKYGMKNE